MPGRFQFQGRRSRSYGKKAGIIAGLFLTQSILLWVVFLAPEGSRIGRSGPRSAVMFVMTGFYVLRLTVTLFLFLWRTIPWWEAMMGILLFPLILAAFLLSAAHAPQGLVSSDVFGILIYVVGSWLGSHSEYQRWRFRMDPRNADHLFTEGLFGYSRHVNYFGDVLVFSGLALVAATKGLFAIPIVMTLSFLLFVIPSHDAYLQGRYGREFEEYQRRTRRFIPWIY